MKWIELEGNSNGGTSVAFLMRLRDRHPGPMKVIWDNTPAHRGEAVREYLRRPGLGLRLVNLPGYSPDFNADEALGLGEREGHWQSVPGKQGGGAEDGQQFLAGLANRKNEVSRCCRTVL